MVSIFCSYIWRNKPIIVKGSLNRYRNFIYINDCVEILAKALSNPKLNNFEIINLTSQVKITVKELIKKIIKVKNFKTYKVRVLKKTPGDSYGFNSKNYYLKKKFPKIKFTTIEVGLKKYFEWIDKLPQKKLNNYHPYSKKIQ